MINEVRQATKKVPVHFLCKHFGVSPSGYYNWLKKSEGLRFVKKEEICKEIRKYFKVSKGSYGSPRIYDDLCEAGYLVSENTVAKYMKEMSQHAHDVVTEEPG